MSIPSYKEYKDSGADWLGELPRHWEVQPCRYFVFEQTTKNENAENQAYLSLLANVGIIPYEEKGDIGNKKPEDLSKCKLVSKGDLVINSMNYGIGSYGLSELDGVCSSVYIVLRPRLNRVKARFAFRIFENRAFQTYAQSFGNGILEHRAAINWDILKGIHVGLPPVEEQEAILAFLDRKIAKIDALIAEQGNLIALLDEKRQATISHAVTKGLNPEALMKDSGVEWLGEVPAHWDVCAVRRVLRRIEQGWSPECFNRPAEGNEWGVLKSGCVNGGTFEATENKVLPDTLEPDPSLEVCDGDLLMSRASGSPALVGSIAHVSNPPPRLMLSDKIFRLHLRQDVFSRFFAIIFSARYVRMQIEQAISGAEGLANNLPQSSLKEFKIAVPPEAEQLKIIAFVETKTGKLNALANEAERIIALLKERRSALITAAVTGQIDVRRTVSHVLTESSEALAA